MKNTTIDTTLLPEIWLTWETTKGKFYLDCAAGKKQTEPEPWMAKRPYERIGKIVLNSGSKPRFAYAKYHEDIECLELAEVTIDTTRKEEPKAWKYSGNKYFLGKDKSVVDEKGNPVGKNVSIEFNINGVFYKRYSDENGYVNMNINLPPGKYIITANYNGLRASNSITVKPVLTASDVNMKYQDGTQFKAKLVDGTGKAYANQKIIFNINGVFYNKITDDEGIASLNINLMAGKYIITSAYANGASASNTITIS